MEISFLKNHFYELMCFNFELDFELNNDKTVKNMHGK